MTEWKCRISQKAILFHGYHIRIDSVYSLYRVLRPPPEVKYFLYIIKCMYWQ
jgi:hypothetical protein